MVTLFGLFWCASLPIVDHLSSCVFPVSFFLFFRYSLVSFRYLFCSSGILLCPSSIVFVLPVSSCVLLVSFFVLSVSSSVLPVSFLFFQKQPVCESFLLYTLQSGFSTSYVNTLLVCSWWGYLFTGSVFIWVVFPGVTNLDILASFRHLVG